MNDKFMAEAIKEAYEGINSSHGGPFGAVIVKDGEIVGKGHNCVLKDNDPTEHGEVMAIRDACRRLNNFDLSGCEIYTTAEPCPMCLGAILWAGIDKIYFGCNRLDTENIGFRDNVFYDVLNGKSSSIKFEVVDREECLELFSKYSESNGKIY